MIFQLRFVGKRKGHMTFHMNSLLQEGGHQYAEWFRTIWPTINYSL